MGVNFSNLNGCSRFQTAQQQPFAHNLRHKKDKMFEVNDENDSNSNINLLKADDKAVLAPATKRVRRTNEQIADDNELEKQKKAQAVADKAAKALATTDKKKAKMPSEDPSEIDINGVMYPVIPVRSAWSEGEKIALWPLLLWIACNGDSQIHHPLRQRYIDMGHSPGGRPPQLRSSPPPPPLPTPLRPPPLSPPSFRYRC